jgi:hypothetical protein
MLQSRTDEVLNADSWCEVQEFSVVTLLQQDTLNIQSELFLLAACQRWAQHQQNINNLSGNKRARHEMKLSKYLDPFLPYVRFLSLTAKQFLEAAENNDLFSEHKLLVILKCLVDPQKYKVPEGFCEITTTRQKPPPPSRNSKLDKIKYHLSAIEIKECVFKSDWYTEERITLSPLIIFKHMVVYGFAYKTLEFALLDYVTQACAARNKVYDESFTVQFINEADKSCVAEYKFEGQLPYDTEVKVDLPQPFLAEKSTPYTLKVEFHLKHNGRKYPRFCRKIPLGHLVQQHDFEFYLPPNGIEPYFLCINKLFYLVF